MLYKDYSSQFVFVADSKNDIEPYYIGNSPGKKSETMSTSVGKTVCFLKEIFLLMKKHRLNF